MPLLSLVAVSSTNRNPSPPYSLLLHPPSSILLPPSSFLRRCYTSTLHWRGHLQLEKKRQPQRGRLLLLPLLLLLLLLSLLAPVVVTGVCCVSSLPTHQLNCTYQVRETLRALRDKLFRSSLVKFRVTQVTSPWEFSLSLSLSLFPLILSRWCHWHMCLAFDSFTHKLLCGRLEKCIIHSLTSFLRGMFLLKKQLRRGACGVGFSSPSGPDKLKFLSLSFS